MATHPFAACGGLKYFPQLLLAPAQVAQVPPQLEAEGQAPLLVDSRAQGQALDVRGQVHAAAQPTHELFHAVALPVGRPGPFCLPRQHPHAHVHVERVHTGDSLLQPVEQCLLEVVLGGHKFPPGNHQGHKVQPVYHPQGACERVSKALHIVAAERSAHLEQNHVYSKRHRAERCAHRIARSHAKLFI